MISKLCFGLLFLGSLFFSSANTNFRGNVPRELISFGTLNTFTSELLDSIPAGTLQYGLADVFDDALYETEIKKGKKNTSTSTTTTTATTSTTSTITFTITPLSAEQMCAEACVLAGSSCYEGGQMRINTDLNYCSGVYASTGASFDLGLTGSYGDFYPTGCFVYTSTASSVVSLNTNDQGTGELGCNAAPAVNPPAGTLRLCACFEP